MSNKIKRQNAKEAKTFWYLIAVLALLSALSVTLPAGEFIPVQDLPDSKPVLAIANAAIALGVYGVLGYAGLLLSRKLKFASIWEWTVANAERFAVSAFVGIGIGIFFIVSDLIFQNFHDLGAIPHPPFPLSIVASITAGIGEEIIFRLFFISFWVWLISFVILKNRYQNRVFWVVALVSALVFALGHIPSLMIIFGLQSPSEIPIAIYIEILLLNGVLSMFAAYYFRKFGILAAISIHFWVDIIWHVIYGLIA